MVPDGWKRTTLGEVAEFKNGLNFTKADKGEAIKIVGVGDFKDLSELRSTDLLETIYVNNKVRDEELLEDGDLLFVRSNGNKDLIGRCLFFPAVATRLSYSGFTIRGRVNKELALPEYIASVTRSSMMKQQISRSGGGTNISNLSQQILNDVAFLLPSLPEQKKIAQILSTWDKAIITTEQLLANSQQQKKALMQQLLTGKKRLLDENGVRFSGEWKKCTLSSFGKSIRGVSYKPENISEKESKDTIRLLRSTNIQNGNLNDKDLVILPKELVKPNQTLEKGDLAICMANGSKALVGKSAPFEGSDITYTVGAFCAIFRPLSEKNAKFVKFLFESSQYQSQLLMILAGSSINNLKGSDIESIKIFTPICLEEQQKIATVLSTADQEISALQQKLETLKQEKKALMQQLLTGRRRVKIDNKEVA
ncbi:restriction endonuclease subunit S [Vibrio navarrensis]|uniref:restriction endonuclease subunit S n=1 Tax=Vibrio navarrensis TaxID=29495 RepID=UPI001559918F|nr:restriction endonuclease subunit S [Vibrio navarrensis]